MTGVKYKTRSPVQDSSIAKPHHVLPPARPLAAHLSFPEDKMPAFRHAAAGLAALVFVACKADVEPTAPPPTAAPDLSLRNDVQVDPSFAFGRGQFLFDDPITSDFAFRAGQIQDAGPAAGFLSFYAEDAGFVLSFASWRFFRYFS